MYMYINCISVHIYIFVTLVKRKTKVFSSVAVGFKNIQNTNSPGLTRYFSGTLKIRIKYVNV